MNASLRAQDRVLAKAKAIIASRMIGTQPMHVPAIVKDYLVLHLGALEHEEFHCLYLNNRNMLIGAEALFRGTLAQTSVYPREVVKSALTRNAGAVIFAHNHPSGVTEPSRADELITQALKQALALVDIRTLDHFVVAGTAVMSFAERGLL